uniref:Uncharacterized protein n=1 Tax=viral metagenome TaxID=1070528 RepID=A0A6M3L9K4_9ZZZZ
MSDTSHGRQGNSWVFEARERHRAEGYEKALREVLRWMDESRKKQKHNGLEYKAVEVLSEIEQKIKSQLDQDEDGDG